MDIAREGLRHYLAAMAAGLLRLVALIALMLMPLGMGAAPAIAAADHHNMTMTAGSSDCDGQQDQGKAPMQTQMDCTGACAALPAQATPLLSPAVMPTAPLLIGAAVRFSGVVPEIATPPPKSI